MCDSQQNTLRARSVRTNCDPRASGKNECSRRLVLGALVCLAAAASIGCEQQHGDRVAFFVAGGEEHDFGKRHDGEIVEHTFSLVNGTATPIRIVGLQTSCGCVQVDRGGALGASDIAPGSAVAVPVRFRVSGVYDATSAQIIVSYRKKPNLDSDKPDEVRLFVRADVVRDYAISPAALDFGEIDAIASPQLVRMITIAPVSLKHLTIKKVRATSEWINAEAVAPTVGKRDWQVKVTLEAAHFAQSQAVTGSVIIETDSSRVPNALVPITANIRSPIDASPEMIVIASNELGAVERRIKVATSCLSRLRRAAAGDDRLDLRIDGDKPSHEHVVRVIAAPCTVTAVDTTVELEFTLSKVGGESAVRTLKIPVYRFIHKGDAT